MSLNSSNEFRQIVRAQDDLILAKGIDVWVGMEPTFTQRFAETPEWLSEALGPEKLHYAYALLREVHKLQPGGIVLHTLGRQYAGEARPRWNIGYYQARYGQFAWEGPPDPCIVPDSTVGQPDSADTLRAFWRSLNGLLDQSGWRAKPFTTDEFPQYRILMRCDGKDVCVDLTSEPQLARASVHGQKIPLTGLSDKLSLNGDLLLCLDLQTYDNAHHNGTCAVLELPEIQDTSIFIPLLQRIAKAARQAGLQHLVLQGFPPPVTPEIAWTTITPDPAVIEINQAPSEDSFNFLICCELFYQASQKIGLYPYRLHYNGEVADSGGGGQITLGGPEPLRSPFFRYPQLLPRLIRYFNAHPVLSYWFAPPSIGSSSQSPRADEGVREAFLELSLALEQLAQLDHPSPELIWQSMSPFMVDPSGNPHRSELNIEKLWNPYLPGRGRLGLVEFRAFRMSRSPECATAISILLRSIVAMLIQQDKTPDLIDHGARLHDKYALPYYLHQDFESVFVDLDSTGFPLHDSIKSILLTEPKRVIGKTSFQGCSVELQQALEFWPLVGDVASQEGDGSRLVDASTKRLQVTLCMEPQHSSRLDSWQLYLDGYCIPLRLANDQQGSVKITGLRYRNFVPVIGLHPGIASRNVITLVLACRGSDEALEITYSEWQPQGLAYPGLPKDIADAEQRRNERFTTKIISFNASERPKFPPDVAVTDYCTDLRRLPGQKGV